MSCLQCGQLILIGVPNVDRLADSAARPSACGAGDLSDTPANYDALFEESKANSNCTNVDACAERQNVSAFERLYQPIYAAQSASQVLAG